ncbi:MAG: endonuclease MutS2 [Eubacteriales bacterium]|nr:endonuclease MutS2 [Eubacteriales bacterium]MDD4389879.1 endonuclease MutS2 [Eubacteriales bacterium]
MNEKSYRVLEYNKIIQMLKEEVASEMTRKIISELKPSVDIKQIRDLCAETTEAVQVIVKKGTLPLGAFYDIGSSLEFARKSGVLSQADLLRILYNIKVARNAVSFLASDLPPLQIIGEIATVLATPKALEENIERCIISEEEMSDNASPELRNIRRAVTRQNESIRNKINQILNSESNKTMLQDSIFTMRSGRFVIPVKQEHRGKFPGIIHDQSQTGATLFIEPQVIVNLNNELRQLEAEERVETQRILGELSSEVAEHFHGLQNNQKLLVLLDLIFAKGKLSYKMDGEEVAFNEEGRLKLRSARHPLIDKKKVVPVSVTLGGEYKTLVITGPNTGGKTVTLKTLGLLAMMAQTGLHIPVNPGSELPIYKKIYADIGDEQSIEQSLSTFSSHMNNIVGIIEGADEETLVLLDELCAGTDPTEGAALAISILDYLRYNGANTVATTHYNELKKYAISTKSVENASMEFDINTLSPTYRLSIGTPGRSNAFEISEKLGLNDEITKRARNLLQSGDIRFEEVIAALEADKKKAEEERNEAIMLNIAIKKEKEQIQNERRKLEEQKDRTIEQAREDARQILKEAQELSKETAKELKEIAKMDSMGERTRRYDENKRKLRSMDAKLRKHIEVEENIDPVKPDDLQKGDRVKLLTIRQNGEVLTLPDSKGDLFLQIGNMKVTANVKNLMKINDGSSNKKIKRQKSHGAMYRGKTQSVSLSINVQGQNLDTALVEVEKYLDDAFIASLPSVTVIHGRGEGILRSGIHAMLKRSKHVESFRKGKYNEGGDGVTIVTLKK